MPEKAVCNCCGRELDFWDLQQDFSIHKEKIAYGSVHDGDALDLRLCCGCFDNFVAVCAESPVKEAK